MQSSHAFDAFDSRYSDVDKPLPAPDAPEKTPLPPCATLDGRFSIGPQEETSQPDLEEADALTNYGNPAESYFMAKLLNRSRIVNTLSEVFAEIVNSAKDSEVREPSPVPQTSVPDADEVKKDTVEPEPERTDESRVNEADVTTQPSDDVSIQINEVSSSSPTECPKSRGRKKGDLKKDANGTGCGRVLRSHDASPPPAPRPATRQASRRPPPPAPPAPDRLLILSRAKPAPAHAPAPAPAAPAAPAPPIQRATRSRDTPVVAAAQKITRSIGNMARELRGDASGNSKRAAAAGRGRPGAAAAPDCSKENCARRRRAAPAPLPRRSRHAAEPEVHSTTGEACARLEPPRALRSRNDASDARVAAGKRARPADQPPLHKVPRLAGPPAPPAERAPRPLARRTSAPWAPALALRNRLRKRLAK